MKARTRGGLILRLATAALLGPLLFAAPARAALFEDDEARRAILELRGRITSNQQDLLRRLERLDQIEASLREAREAGDRQAARISERVDGSTSVAARAQLDLAQQLEKLSADLARLRGDIENLTNEISNTQKRQRDFYVDLDARLRKLEPQQQTVDGKPALIEQNETRSFEAALAAFRASDFKEAISEFGAFLRRYPASPYAASAQYWLGTSQYALRDYKAAIATQQDLLKKWPDSPRAAEALLNIASSQADMNDKRGARKTLEAIVATYPNTPTAGVAKDRLAVLK